MVKSDNAQPTGEKKKNQDQRKRVEKKALVPFVGDRRGHRRKCWKLFFFFFFFSCCRGPDAAQRAHDVSAFGVVSGKGREVGWRGGEEQAVSVKCWLMGLRAADQTPWLGPWEEKGGRARGKWKRKASVRGPSLPPPHFQTEAFFFFLCQAAATHNWWLWNWASSGQGKIWECVPGSAQGKPFHCGPESPLQIPDRERRNGTSAAQRNWNPVASTVRTVSAWESHTGSLCLFFCSLVHLWHLNPAFPLIQLPNRPFISTLKIFLWFVTIKPCKAPLVTH